MTHDFSAVEACVFDAYGTLLDVTSAARRCRDALGDRALALSATWRGRQLEYTWLRSLMGRYADFWQVTGEALDYAMAVHGFDDAELRTRLMELYLNLEAFPGTAEMLDRIKRGGRRTAILSNGSPLMLAGAVDSGGLRPSLDAIVSVDPLRIYKPHPSVYQLACDHLAVARDQILFVSANGWDAAGAASFGFRVAWLNRTGAQRERLPVRPDFEIASLDEVPALLTASGG